MEGHRARLSGFLFFVEIQGPEEISIGVRSWWTRGKVEYKCYGLWLDCRRYFYQGVRTQK